jgi:hypothetical protein
VTAKLNPSAEQLLALRKGIIAELWEHPRYKHLIEELRARRPSIPYWKPAYVTKQGVLIPDNTSLICRPLQPRRSGTTSC